MKHSACGYCKWKANGGHTVAMRMIDALADLLLGAQCPGCDVPRWGICPDCASQLAVPPQHVTRTGLVPIVAANPYRPLLCRIIPRYKDDGALHIEQFLVRRLAEALRVLSPPPDAVLVHVPSRPKAVRERGFDHGARLAAEQASWWGCAPVERYDVEQAGGISRSWTRHHVTRICVR